jgi:SNF2 family DNA or RNA helicase
MLKHDAGLGKTSAVISYLSAAARYPTTKPLPTLIICPKNVTNVWKEEFKHSFLYHRVVVITTNNHSSEIPNNSIVLTNYSVIRSMSRRRKGTTCVKEVFWLTQWGTIICDEAHHVRNDGQTTLHVRNLKRKNTILITAKMDKMWLLDHTFFIYRNFDIHLSGIFLFKENTI